MCVENKDILKKFNEERKARQIAEDKALEVEKNVRMLVSDNKYLREEMSKKEKDFNEEITRYMGIKRELEQEFIRRNQDLAELNSELSNFKIKEKHLNKIIQDAKDENVKVREEFDKLRKFSLDAENTKIKKLQDEVDELKTINQLYRSQRLESDEEILILIKEKDKFRSDFMQIKKELYI